MRPFSLSVVYFDLLNIHILCAGGEQLPLLWASHLHAGFSQPPKTDER